MHDGIQQRPACFFIPRLINMIGVLFLHAAACFRLSVNVQPVGV